MSLKKFLPIPFIVAFLAFTIQTVDQLLHGLVPPVGNVGFGWIAFQSWAMYFLAGCNIKGGIKTLIGYVFGIVASIAIMELGGAFMSMFGFYAFPLGVFIVVVPVMFMERVPWLDLIPAVFVGAGAFFAFMSYVPNATYAIAITTELVYCLVGLAYGVMTIFFRTKYEERFVNADKPEKAVEESQLPKAV